MSRNRSSHSTFVHRALLGLARTQHGVIHIAQLHAAGVVTRDIELLVNDGSMICCLPGVYRAVSSPATFQQRSLAAVLAVGRQAMLHRLSAGVLLGLPNCPEPMRPQILIAQTVRCRIDGVELRRRTHFPYRFGAVVDGVPTLCPAMTIVELEPILGRRWSEHATHFALRTGLMTLADLASAVEFYADTSKKFHRIGARLHSSRTPDDLGLGSEWEARVLRWIRRGRFPEPVLQYPLVVEGRSRRLDFAYSEQKVAIEFDGFVFHNDRTTFDRDRAVENWLRLNGWLLLRFTATTKYAEFVAQLRAAFARRQI